MTSMDLIVIDELHAELSAAPTTPKNPLYALGLYVSMAQATELLSMRRGDVSLQQFSEALANLVLLNQVERSRQVLEQALLEGDTKYV